MSARDKPLLIFDGDCGFCRYWVDYWRHLSGGRVDYAPYQDVAEQFPAISAAEFQRSIYLIEPDGRCTRGAEAAFAVLRRAPGRGGWSWAYARVPGFAYCAERAYDFISRHRVAAHHLSRWLWGKHRRPARYERVAALFLRGLGLIYLAAFASLGTQILGLVGAAGILPLENFLSALADAYGPSVLWQVPMLFWIYSNDLVLQLACWSGAALGALVALGLFRRTLLVALFLLYLSLFYAGQDFMSFQWDLLLLETGFLAIFLPRNASPLLILLFRWLLFRFMFLAGWVKLASHDHSWRDLSALSYHFETQPLPSALAWYAHHLPDRLLRFATGATFFVELVLPFLIFAPRRPRRLAAAGILCLQLSILATGSYNFFNLLTMLLCIFLFDDAALARLAPRRWQAAHAAAGAPPPAGGARGLTGVLLAAVILSASGVLLYEQMARRPAWRPMHRYLEIVSPFRIVNPYGVFAIMTTTRLEIVVEHSDDGRHWQPYRFRYKPGPLERRPRWNVPHQPRLDWQMWFAALSDADHQPWFGNFLVRLLQNSPPVLDLLERDSAPAHPPKYVRAMIYKYNFTTPAEKRRSGHWWKRSPQGVYFPSMSLRMIVTPGQTVWPEP